MTRIYLVPLIAMLAFAPSARCEARMLHIKDAPFSASGDGVADDRPALARAFAQAKPGDTLIIAPGEYRIVLTGGPLAIPEGVTVWGQAGKSKFALVTDGKPSDYREFLRPKSDVTVEGITIERTAEFPGILLPISGDASNITFRNCHIIGAQARFPKRDCHAFRVGFGVVKKFTLTGVMIEDCCYGLFQPNDATGTLEGVLVENSRFERNTASDLEFNSPKGRMSSIIVRDCFFRDNLCKSPSGGFAVGFANVASGRVEKCVIENYGSEALHVEDRSTDIHLVGNTITGGSLRQPNGVILVINDSKRVNIENNIIDARSNKNSPHLILVTAGGKNFAKPSEVSVKGNVLIHGPTTRTWYLQEGSSSEPTGNVVTGR